MRNQRWLAPIFFCLLLPLAQAQLGGGAGLKTGSLHVHVVYADDRRAGANLLVRLMEGSSSTPAQTTYTNDIGKADFRNIPLGEYHVVVSGDGIQTTESALFEVDSRQVTQAQYVTVRRLQTAEEQTAAPNSGSVSASALNIPPKARKDLDKANEAMARQQWSKAAELLNKAISIYPQYAAAYNNLAIVYAHTNDPAREKEALEKAFSLDEHYVPACENLAKLYLREKDFSRAEAVLGKVLSVDPNNGLNLTLLADAQYMERQYGAAIATAQKVHALPGQHPSTIHYIAAMAYQQESRRQDALAEFQMFLKEEPTGPRADRVRSDLAKMQASAQ